MHITQEQWNRIVTLAKLNKGLAEWHETALNPYSQQAVKAANDFQKSIMQLQARAGQSSEQLSELQGALLDMARQED